MSESMLAKSSEIVWALLESYEIDPVPLFREADIDPKLMNDMSARISQSKVNELWLRVGKVIDDPCIGLKVGSLWHPSYMHALGYSWLSSSTLRTALERLVRYIHVVNQSSEIKLSEKNNEVSIMWTDSAHKGNSGWHADGTMTILIAMCRANYGESLDPVSVTFKHEKPVCSGEFLELFRCPIEFGAKHDQLVLSSKVVDKRLSGSNPLMAQIADQEMIKYLAKLDENDIVQRVKASIIDLLPDGRISDQKVADALYMSNRTLQRKLQVKGSTFKNILVELRKELAMKYIQDNQMTLTELSFQLGFSEMSSFSRAFKQWTGSSPREYRQAV
jgi:AraC-like DNA-binding protein